MIGRPLGGKNKEPHMWTKDELEYLKEITPGHHYKEVQELMNIKYNLDFTSNQITGAIRRYKFITGFTGHFEKQHIPANKGVSGCAKGCEKGWFKKGQDPINHREIGSERITVDGYIEVKVAEPHKWRTKHQLIWKKHNGDIPKGHIVIFGDGNRLNLDINNLILVSRLQLLLLNRNKLIQEDADLTRTGVIIADLYQKLSKIKKKK